MIFLYVNLEAQAVKIFSTILGYILKAMIFMYYVYVYPYRMCGRGVTGGGVLGRVLGGHLYDLYDCDYGAVQATAGVISAGNRSTRWVASL